MKSLSKFSALLFVSMMLVVSQLHAAESSNFKTKFMSLGGSESGYNQIIANAKATQANNLELEKKIVQTYYPQLNNLMSQPVFDEVAYAKIYNQIEQEKAAAVQKNLNSIMALMKNLSPIDRKAYAGYLYANNAVNSATPPAQAQTPAVQAPVNNNQNTAPNNSAPAVSNPNLNTAPGPVMSPNSAAPNNNLPQTPNAASGNQVNN